MARLRDTSYCRIVGGEVKSEATPIVAVDLLVAIVDEPNSPRLISTDDPWCIFALENVHDMGSSEGLH